MATKIALSARSVMAMDTVRTIKRRRSTGGSGSGA